MKNVMIVDRLGCLNCEEYPLYVLPEKELRGLSPNFHIHASASDLCIRNRRIGPYFPASKIGRAILGIYASLTYNMNVEIGTVATHFFFSISGNICFEFSVLCLCSVVSCGSLRQASSSIMFDSFHLYGEAEGILAAKISEDIVGWLRSWKTSGKVLNLSILIFGDQIGTQRRAVGFGALSS